MEIFVPECSLILLIGISGSGKTMFAHKHFKLADIISLDHYRNIVLDNNNGETTYDNTIEVIRLICSKRLAKARLTLIDGNNLQNEYRKQFVSLSKEYHFSSVAIVFNIPEQLCRERNKSRSDYNIYSQTLNNQQELLNLTLNSLDGEGFNSIYILRSPDEVDNIKINLIPLQSNKKHLNGPFDIVGDIHGCFDELYELLLKLGYKITFSNNEYRTEHKDNRKIIFLGDLVDRGPKIAEVMRFVMDLVKSDDALCVPGNHDIKLVRKLKDKDAKTGFGVAESINQLEKEGINFTKKVTTFLDSLVSHYVLDNGKLIVAHAGMKEEYQGRGSSIVREFALFGESTGEIDEYGLTSRYDWAKDYKGKAIVVYGHTPVAQAEWVNNTINIDTGCVFGGILTALRYPENELVSVKAKHTYYTPMKPFLAEKNQAPTYYPRSYHNLLDINDVLGNRLIQTSYLPSINISEEITSVTLEFISQFAIIPSALIYLPPTVLPPEASKFSNLLEHPTDAFNYYFSHGISKIICIEKQIGVKAIIIICKNKETALKYFNITDSIGICYNQFGCSLFGSKTIEDDILDNLNEAMESANIWNELNTNWIIMECNVIHNLFSKDNQENVKGLHPFRLKLKNTIDQLSKAESRGVDVNSYKSRFEEEYKFLNNYFYSYKEYFSNINSIFDLKIAPLYILASEGKVHSDKDNLWHLKLIEKICYNNYPNNKNKNILVKTPYRTIDNTDTKNKNTIISWWEELNIHKSEGIIVKPYNFMIKKKSTLIQPAIKCRNKEFLKLIYGTDYNTSEKIKIINNRDLSNIHSLAIKEFALGIEALQRFVRNEPLYRVHECVFANLALKISALNL
ncbi:MAG: polynucleotide kinase-phosphatase [Spirochaetota bacterium]|nr:polynucleotide kinase-phosphatase [Spirochaetota bacterium]